MERIDQSPSKSDHGARAELDGTSGNSLPVEQVVEKLSCNISVLKKNTGLQSVYLTNDVISLTLL